MSDWNDGYIVEGCDRLFIISTMVEDHLLEHPAIIKSGAQNKIDKAHDLLLEAYQMVGALDDEE